MAITIGELCLSVTRCVTPLRPPLVPPLVPPTHPLSPNLYDIVPLSYKTIYIRHKVNDTP